MTYRVRVNVPSGSYGVFIGEGVLRRAGALLAGLGQPSGFYILSSPRVWRLWGARLQAGLRPLAACQAILFDDRETAKRLATVERLCRALARAGADRDAVLVALGGGVVGDVAGFTAAIYLRGVRLVQVPTTLLAQVDAAVGGKTGVNLPEGKNLVGAFHQPHLVLCELATLRTLPAREFRAGLYEVIKCGVIRDARLFAFLERHLDVVLARQRTALSQVIARAVRVKAEVVRGDERETSGERRVLNFGHTIGHALESLTGYRRFRHGEAVGWGMLAESEIAVAQQRLRRADCERIARLIRNVGPLPALPHLSWPRLRAALHVDKKTRGGRLHFVLPQRIGAVGVYNDVPETLVRDVLDRLRSSHQSER
ncbi:MAG: 3-dehydroquinate synthase [Firmicutes bacterium]|nr:3-dehydroquinate synthase [Bacillota bacterium]